MTMQIKKEKSSNSKAMTS